ncbi:MULTISPECIES: permease-like cell division protein FtsX [Actinoallomurus]|uniref:permease-like cell division protein FtsX n=1 Tax=Actinoallomurus TaxID=667113 RepID=UPI00209377A7|nr:MULTISPECIES: permease-like cell division protein FtsX [Actinoallomurus]MCO5969102.1 permease-like cell division protein FtsX [Actinoallomurus soli]MCO5998827.1 permease-like cell division protein FtsX [Actinoallomurus rhizosphaericola]
MRVQFVLQEIWIGLRRNLTMTIALIVTVAIAMALFGTGVLLKMQVDKSNNYWSDKVEVSIYLCNKLSANPNCKKTEPNQSEKDAIRKQLESMPQVAKVVPETAQEAYQRAKEQFKDSPGIAGSIQPGDIPDSFRVKLKDPKNFAAVVAQMSNREGVDQVVNERAILDKFFKILSGLQWAALIIAAIQLIAAVLLVANTIRLSAFNRRRETGIMRLVGASNVYIQLPFVLEGAIAGLVGGVFAAILLSFSKVFLLGRLQKNLQLATPLGWLDVTTVIVASMCFGILLCALASFLTLRRYLKI